MPIVVIFMVNAPVLFSVGRNYTMAQMMPLRVGVFIPLLTDDGMGFSLVPWRPVVEQRLRLQVAAVVRGSSITWDMGRRLGR